jgi:hypothetical protein
MRRIDTEENARRLARAVLADVRLYSNEPGERESNVVAGRDLFRERVDPALYEVFEQELAKDEATAAEPAPHPAYAPTVAAPAAHAHAPAVPAPAPLAPHVCPNCGAPLPIGVPGSIEHCRFCAAETREPARPRLQQTPAPAAPAPWSPPRAPAPPPRMDVPTEDPFRSNPVPGPGRTVLIAFLVATFAVIAFVGFSVEQAGTKADRAEAKQAAYRAGVSAQAAQAAAAAKAAAAPAPPVALADLATASLGTKWHPLTAPPAPGDPRSFDPILSLHWAVDIAQTWRPDAHLTHLQVDQAGRDGAVDLGDAPGRADGDGALVYSFTSPGCASASASRACTLKLRLTSASERPRVEVAAVRENDAAEVREPKCSLRKAFAALDKAGWLPSDRAFRVELVDPKWTFSKETEPHASVGVVSAVTCAAAPK